jgi:hypothetical protein
LKAVGFNAFLVTFSCAQKVTRRRNRGPNILQLALLNIILRLFYLRPINK